MTAKARSPKMKLLTAKPTAYKPSSPQMKLLIRTAAKHGIDLLFAIQEVLYLVHDGQLTAAAAENALSDLHDKVFAEADQKIAALSVAH